MILGLAGIVAVAAFALPAGAQSVTDLQAQINALLAQLSALQGSSSASGCYAFTQDLTIGSQNAEVTALQNYLAGGGYFSVAATGYFGPITQSALASWQAANGVAPAAGYWGPISRAKYNSVCTPTTTGGGTSGGGSTSGGFFGGNDEGYLDDFDQLSKYSSEEVGEGAEDVAVLGVEFEAKDADQMIERVIVRVDAPTGSDDLDDFISDVSLWLNGDEIGRMDVDDASHNRSLDRFDFRFVGLEGIVEEGDVAELIVAVSGVNNLDGSDAGDGWDIAILADSIRAASPNGVVDEYDSTEYDETFTVETFASATGVELRITESSNNPNATTVKVDDTADTDGVLLLAFDMEARNSDIEIFEIPVTFTIASGTLNVSTVANRVTLVIDGDEYSESVPTGAASANGSTTIVFDNIDFVLDEGDEVEVEVLVDLNEQDGNYDEGETIRADVDAGDFDAEDESGEDLGVFDKSGSVLGENQTLRTSGAVLTAGSMSVKSIENNDASTTDNQAEFKMTFAVEAFETDLFIAKSAAASTTLGVAGVNYQIEDASAGGTATTTGTVTSSLTSTADTSGTCFRISDGQTKNITLTVVFDPALTSFYQLQLNSLNFASSCIDPTELQAATPAEDFETDSTNILN